MKENVTPFIEKIMNENENKCDYCICKSCTIAQTTGGADGCGNCENCKNYGDNVAVIKCAEYCNLKN